MNTHCKCPYCGEIFSVVLESMNTELESEDEISAALEELNIEIAENT